MEPFKAHIEIDTRPHSRDERPFPTKFGLPEEVRFCSRCVISNQRPNSTVEYAHHKDSKKETIHFDEEEVCDACRVAEAKEKIDWKERERQLLDLCDRHRSKDGSYDCICPGSGGKDSVYASHILKHKYGMHPLTVTWAPHIHTDWGWKNFQAWLHAGFDNYLCTPNGRIHRLLTRLATETLLHPFQPFIFGQKSTAPKLAAQLGIPLIFYGENEAEYGNAIASFEQFRQDFNYFSGRDRSEIYLGGIALSDLKERFGISDHDLQPYWPADPESLAKKGVAVHYLGYYLKWHPQSAYYYAVDNAGFQACPERTPGTYSKYNSIDDKVDDLHYYTTYIKFGIGRATYDASQEVRSGDITREEGVALVKRYDGEWPERFAQELFAYLSLPPEEFPEASKMFEQPLMTREYFLHLCDRFRPAHLWKREGDSWKLRRTVWEGADSRSASMDSEAVSWTGNPKRD